MDELAIDELAKIIFDQEEFIDELVELTEEGGAPDEEIFDRIDESRDLAGQLIADLSDIEFRISDDADDRADQRLLLGEMREVGKRVQGLRDYPEVLRYLRLQRETLFAALEDTYHGLAPYVIEFSDDEATRLRLLLRRSVLDEDDRADWAHAIDSSIQVAKIFFRISERMTA